MKKDINHTVGENQTLYFRYKIEGSNHIGETEQLCEIIRQLDNMTELKLYKFINENKIEWHHEQDGIYIFIPFSLIREFTYMMGNYLTDSVFEVVLKESYICIKINEICEYFDIDINNVFDKDGK